MNNKIKTILFTLLILMTSTKAYAYDIAVENADGVTIYYNYINDGKELEVVGATGYKNNIVIPEEVTYMNRTRKVTNIGEAAFENHNSLTNVTIPNSVTSIGDKAFLCCSGLTSVIIPNNVTTIGKMVFRECVNLNSVTIGNNVKYIEDWAFIDCISLTSLVIPNSVISIGKYAFCSCESLVSLTIGNNVTNIGDGAFSHLVNLKSITIPSSVSSIGNSAFYRCSHLTSITIPNNVLSIGMEAFEGIDLSTIIMQIKNPFEIIGKESKNRTFSKNTFNNATLYVPKGTIEKYKATEGWKDFLFIEEGDGSGSGQPSQRCDKPTISYSKGKLTFNCATSGATCKYTINDTDIKSGSGDEVKLGVTYNISVYATKAGYEDSETATATLCWIDVDPKTEGIVNGVASVRSYGVMIQASEGFFNISGLDVGTPINIYNTAGQMVGSAKAASETTIVNTTLRSGEIGIVKIGDKSVKVLMK